MKEKMPFCPNCKCSIFVGKVRSYDLVKSRFMKAWFCSNCLTEFDKNRNVMQPLLDDYSDIRPWVLEFVKSAKEDKVNV